MIYTLYLNKQSHLEITLNVVLSVFCHTVITNPTSWPLLSVFSLFMQKLESFLLISGWTTRYCFIHSNVDLMMTPSKTTKTVTISVQAYFILSLESTNVTVKQLILNNNNTSSNWYGTMVLVACGCKMDKWWTSLFLISSICTDATAVCQMWNSVDGIDLLINTENYSETAILYHIPPQQKMWRY